MATAHLRSISLLLAKKKKKFALKASSGDDERSEAAELTWEPGLFRAKVNRFTQEHGSKRAVIDVNWKESVSGEKIAKQMVHVVTLRKRHSSWHAVLPFDMPAVAIDSGFKATLRSLTSDELTECKLGETSWSTFRSEFLADEEFTASAPGGGEDDYEFAIPDEWIENGPRRCIASVIVQGKGEDVDSSTPFPRHDPEEREQEDDATPVELAEFQQRILAKLHENQSRMDRTARKYFRNKADADKAVQEAFVKIIQKIPTLKHGENIPALLELMTFQACVAISREEKTQRKLNNLNVTSATDLNMSEVIADVSHDVEEFVPTLFDPRSWELAYDYLTDMEFDYMLLTEHLNDEQVMDIWGIEPDEPDESNKKSTNAAKHKLRLEYRKTLNKLLWTIQRKCGIVSARHALKPYLSEEEWSAIEASKLFEKPGPPAFKNDISSAKSKVFTWIAMEKLRHCVTISKMDAESLSELTGDVWEMSARSYLTTCERRFCIAWLYEELSNKQLAAEFELDVDSVEVTKQKLGTRIHAHMLQRKEYTFGTAFTNAGNLLLLQMIASEIPARTVFERMIKSFKLKDGFDVARTYEVYKKKWLDTKTPTLVPEEYRRWPFGCDDESGVRDG